MKKAWVLAVAALAAAGGLEAARQDYQGRGFEAYVQRSGGGNYREFLEAGRPTLKVRAGEEYSIVVRNPLPVRAAVAISIDGLNSVDGKRSTPGKARKWILEPGQSFTLSGWQTGSDKSRALVFTDESASYAKWKGAKDRKDYARNLGVIGVAWFWNAAELELALHPPQPFEDEQYVKAARGKRMDAQPAAPSAASAGEGSRAGTGMGRQRENHVTEVASNESAGMYKLQDVLKIYYEFASEPPLPLPFEGEDGDGRFAPEMNG
jgi:hypothetical protein